MRAIVLVALAGCLGPQVSDEMAPSGDIVPAGTPIPSIDDDEDAATIAANDGVDGVVTRYTAFAAGAQVHYWDFGPAQPVAAPIYFVVQRMADGTLVRTDHPPIIGTIPGEGGYSPFWSELDLVVTADYAGELITSSTAIEEAERDGLIEAPMLGPRGEHFPIVASDVMLDVGTATPIGPNAIAFYEHHTVSAFDFGAMPIDKQVDVAVAAHYVLHREGEDPLSEPLRGIDLDADGDVVDTNDVFERAPGDPMRSPLSREIDVAVVPSTTSIDNSKNDAVAEIEAATQLFDPNPVSPTVVGVQMTSTLHDCPLQQQAGGL